MKTIAPAVRAATDPITAMRQLMLEELALASSEHYTNPTLAQALVTRLQKEDPELLARYLHARAVYLITLELGQLNRSDRSYRRANASRSAFAAAAETFEATGDDRLLLNARFVVDPKGTTKVAAKMTADDHRYVANERRLSSKMAAFQAKFHLAVADKLGHRVTADVFSESQYRNLYQSFATEVEAASVIA